MNKINSFLYRDFYYNKKKYFIALIIFFIGIIIGVMVVRNSTAASRSSTKEYLDTFIKTVKDNNYNVSKIDLLKQCVKQNVILVATMWFTGSTIIGVPIIYGIVGYKGFCLGYTIASIIECLGICKGSILIILGLMLQSLFIIPAIILIAVSSMKLYEKIMTNKKRENIKIEILRHSAIAIISTIIIIISSFVETYISTTLMLWYIKFI